MIFIHIVIIQKKRFDLVVGNPPYIRFQFSTDQQGGRKIFSIKQIEIFQIHQCMGILCCWFLPILKDRGGKITCFYQQKFTGVLLVTEKLVHFLHKANIISFEKLLFPDIQQEVVLLL
jgi:tRNA1(Val) A37 N6-methylase TrmN6